MDDVACAHSTSACPTCAILNSAKRTSFCSSTPRQAHARARAADSRATQLQRVEDLYKPYRKKRMTRAQKAREAGLEPLANMIIMQASAKGSALDAAAAYVNEEAGFDTPEKALVARRTSWPRRWPRTPRTSPTCALLRKTPPISSSRPPTPPRRPPTSRTTAMMSRCAVYPTTACWLSTAVSARASSACA